MNPSQAATPATLRAPALAVLALLATLGTGCTTSTEGLFGTRVDYKSGAAKTAPLEVPPDLSQLARDSRYQPQGGVVSAAASSGPRNTAVAAPGAPSVALDRAGDLRIVREGGTRWLVTTQTPEQLWPQLKAFWASRGFTLAVDDPAVGVMETDWAENRAKLPSDIIRNTLGRVLPNLFDSGLRDRYRTRIERTASGSEVFVSHRGLSEEYTNTQKDATAWRPRPTDPELEAEFLSRLMVALGSKEEAATVAVAAAAPGGPAAPARARGLAGQPAPALEVDEPFDRAWRRVGLALDRGGFTVEDRDRANGLYYVRYVDPANVGKDEPNWFMKLIGSDPNPQAAQRFRIALKGGADKTTVSVLTFAGAPDSGANGQRIATLLVNELR